MVGHPYAVALHPSRQHAALMPVLFASLIVCVIRSALYVVMLSANVPHFVRTTATLSLSAQRTSPLTL